MRVGLCKGDIVVADVEELNFFDPSEIRPRRLNAQGVLVSQNGKEFIFPCAGGTLRFPGRDQVFQTSPTQDLPEQGEKSTTMFFNETRTGLCPSDQQLTDATEARGWELCLSSSRSTKGETLCAKLGVIHHVPVKCIDVVRRTTTTLDVLMQSRIDDCWNIDHTWHGERLAKVQATSRPDSSRPEVSSNMPTRSQ